MAPSSTNLLKQVRAISAYILENGDAAVGFMARRFEKRDARRQHARMIASEIIRFKKQENAPAGLIANARELFRCRSARQQQRAAASASGLHNDPAFRSLIDVLNQLKAKLVAILGNRLVIVTNQQGKRGDGLH